MEQKVEIKDGAKISTELKPFSLIRKISQIKKSSRFPTVIQTKNCRRNEKKFIQCAFLFEEDQAAEKWRSIRLYAYRDDTRVENNIHKSIDPSLRSQAKESAKGKSHKSCDLNAYIKNARIKLHQIFCELEEQNQPITACLLQEIFFGQDKVHKEHTIFIARHFDKEHPHVYIAYNRINNDGRTLSDKNERLRSARICKELTLKYGLHMAKGKDHVKTERLREPDKTKYELYNLLKTGVRKAGNWKELIAGLNEKEVDVRFKYKRKSDEVQDVVFIMNGYSFSGSKIDSSAIPR